MASQPLEPPVTARVDRDCRLLRADPPLQALQEQAGGKPGAPLAVPQLVAVARLAMRLGVAVRRSAIAATDAEDLDLWVRAEPDGEGVTLTIEQWTARPPLRPRWARSAGFPAEDSPGATEDLLTDGELRVTQLSPAVLRRLGSAAEQAIGQSLARLVHPLEDAEGNLPLLSALAARAAFRNQPALVRGTDDHVLLDGDPRTVGERFAGYAVRIRPAVDAPSPADALPLDDLLREPLSAIIGQAQQIADRAEGPLRNDYAGYGADIAAAARHLLDLITSIGPNGEGSGGGELLDLAELVLDAAGLVQPQAAARHVMLDIGGAVSLPGRGQARAVTQILVNLIGNAVRFSPERAAVAITLEAGEQMSVTVADRGSGVAEADRSRIFERFEQADANPGAAGLGLAISRRLARDMGGEVELLDSEVGACFRLRLPAA